MARGETAVSDSTGDFELPVDSGAVDLQIVHPDHEGYAQTIRFDASRRLEFSLRRLAPYVRDYLSVSPISGSESGLETALVADLQGFANVDSTVGGIQLWFGSTPFTTSLNSGLDDVEWVHTDSITVQVLVWLAPGLASRDSVQWSVRDVDGHTARWLCYPAGREPECEERF